MLKGLQCPFGQAVNAMGNGCELKVQVCEHGSRLNPAKDKCVPGPGKYVPFPLLIVCALLSLPVFVSYSKSRLTRVSSSLIALFSLMETVGLLVQTVLAYAMGVYATFALSLVALLFQYGCNLFFTMVYVKNVLSEDQAFKHWAAQYPGTQNAVVVTGTLVNFKVYRGIYCRLFSKPQFNSVFEDPEIFFKPFTMISVFSLLTTMVPLLTANIIGLVFLEYGYQV